MIGLHSSDNSPSSNCLKVTALILRGVEDPNLMVLMEGLGSWSGKRYIRLGDVEHDMDETENVWVP